MKNYSFLLAGLAMLQPVAQVPVTEKVKGMKFIPETDPQEEWRYYNKNLSALGYDADAMNFLNYMGNKGASALGFKNYDADFKNYDMPQNMDQKAIQNYLSNQVASGAMTTFRLRIFYTPVNGTPAPVNITLFDSAFAGGTFDGSGNLVFTNAGGDTATIQGLTTNGQSGRVVSIEQLYNMTETEPFTIGFMRMKVKTSAQFDYAIGIIKDGQFGGYGGNSITPDDYVDPNQFQLLRVDVPLNVDASKKSGFDWTIDEDQTGTGIGITLFIPTTLDPTKALGGKDPVRNLNGGQGSPFYVPDMANPSFNPKALNTLAANPAIKGIMASGVDQATGQNMITNILSGMNKFA